MPQSAVSLQEGMIVKLSRFASAAVAAAALVVPAGTAVGTSTSTMADDIITFCRDRMAHFKAPRSVEFVDELPHSGSGKVLKRDLKERYRSGGGA